MDKYHHKGWRIRRFINRILGFVVHKERQRQISLGFTGVTDNSMGVDELMRWALHYQSQGKHLQAVALLQAANDIRPRKLI